jgi:hypothetical protein
MLTKEPAIRTDKTYEQCAIRASHATLSTLKRAEAG